MYENSLAISRADGSKFKKLSHLDQFCRLYVTFYCDLIINMCRMIRVVPFL